MRALVLVGVLLIIVGGICLGYEGITYVTREQVAKVGPVEVTADRQRTIWFSPLAGAIALASGIALVAVGVTNRRPAT